MVERSTVGAAGFNRETKNRAGAKITTATPAKIHNRRFLFSNKSGRAISITFVYVQLTCQMGRISIC